jgi:hypothetical protein
MIFVIIALLFAAILLSGLLSREARRERLRRQLLANGERCPATVVSAELTGQKRGGLREVALELALEDGRRAQAHEMVTPTELTSYREGAQLRVALSPNREDAPRRAIVTGHV